MNAYHTNQFSPAAHDYLFNPAVEEKRNRNAECKSRERILSQIIVDLEAELEILDFDLHQEEHGVEHDHSMKNYMKLHRELGEIDNLFVQLEYLKPKAKIILLNKIEDRVIALKNKVKLFLKLFTQKTKH